MEEEYKTCRSLQGICNDTVISISRIVYLSVYLNISFMYN